MTTSYGGTPPGLSGTHYGGSSLGVLGSAVPSAGLSGAGYLYAGLTLPDDADVELRGVITRWPTAGTLTVFEDSSFEYVGASDYAEFRLYEDGVASSTDIGYGAGIGRFTLTVGSAASLTGTLTLGDIVASGLLSSTVPSALSGTLQLGPIVASGSLASAGVSALSGTLQIGAMVASGTLSSSAPGPSAMSGTLVLGDIVATGTLAGRAAVSAPPIGRRLSTRTRSANISTRTR
jgi:hypothetical protein